MSEIDQIEESLRIADEVLSAASLEDKDDFLKSISEEYLVKTFEKNVDFKTILNDLFPDISYIRKYRSSYLPTEFFLSRNEGGVEEVVDFADSLESYENTFMRLLGMPNVIRLVDGNPKGDTLDEILIPDFITGELKQVSFSTLVRDVLDERQRVGSQRKVRVDPETIFNISENYNEEVASGIQQHFLQAEDWESLRQVSGITSSIYDVNAGDSAITSGAFFAKIDQLHEDFLKFSYLLFPPVQDHRIATRINEPSKIVGEPFSNSFSSINGNRVRPPLLESIIRIRLDRLSGTRIDTPDAGFEDALPSLGPDSPDYLNSNNYGLLESIIIKRLDASVNALASLCEVKIKNLKEELSKTGTVIKNPKFASNISSNKRIPTDSSTASDAEQAPLESAPRGGLTMDELSRQADIDKKIEELTNQKNVEDAILALLSFEPTVGSISAIDEQVNTLRSSSINDAHLASAFLSILKTQSKHVNSKLVELQKLKKEGSPTGTIQKDAAEISTLIGIDIGIGTLDILAYVFALFVLDEASLLGLLPKKSFEYLKTEYNSLLEGTATQQSLTESINNLTKLVLNVYRRFQKKLKES